MIDLKFMVKEEDLSMFQKYVVDRFACFYCMEDWRDEWKHVTVKARKEDAVSILTIAGDFALSIVF